MSHFGSDRHAGLAVGRIGGGALPVLLAAGLLALAGCGGSSSNSSSPASTASTPAAPTTSPSSSGSSSGALSSKVSLAASANGQLSYDTKTLHAKAGKVSIDFTNSSPVEHNVTIEGAGKQLGATPTFQGGSKTLTLDLQAGTYKFFCSVPGHRAAGMEGTLIVE
jgi:plastocyanin